MPKCNGILAYFNISFITTRWNKDHKCRRVVNTDDMVFSIGYSIDYPAWNMRGPDHSRPFPPTNIPKMACGISHCCFKTARSIPSSRYRIHTHIVAYRIASLINKPRGPQSHRENFRHRFDSRPFYNVTNLIRNGNSAFSGRNSIFCAVARRIAAMCCTVARLKSPRTSYGSME